MTIRQWKWVALAAGLGLGIAAPAAAQDRIGLITIENVGKEERRVCVYKNKKINLKAERCFDIPGGREAIWARGENRKNERFDVKIFRKRNLLPPKFRYEKEGLEGDTVRVRVGSASGFSYSRYRAPVAPLPRYRVKFCNKTQPGKVWVAIAASNANAAVSEGYWNIPRGECITINYTERLQRFGGGKPKQAPQIMYRAYTTGENALRWEGTEANEDPLICINPNKRFARSLIHTGANGERAPRPCDGEGLVAKRFRFGPTLDSDVQVGVVNF